MNKVILFFAAVSPLTLACTSIGQAGADEPVVTKVVFSSHTNDDDKDHDTGI
jgi:hypothetical protein